jgi:hypothetical protein
MNPVILYFLGAIVLLILLGLLDCRIRHDLKWPVEYDSAMEAMKLLKEWAIWISTIQTGLLAFLGYFYKKQCVATFHWPTFVAAGCFCISLLSATLLLGALPALMRKLKKDTQGEENDFYESHIFNSIPIKLGYLSFIEHLFFFIGLVFYVYGLFNGF